MNTTHRLAALAGITVVAGSLTLAPAADARPIPDPGFSACVFPEGSLCAAGFSIEVTVRNQVGPLEDSIVWAVCELVSGTVALPDSFPAHTGAAGKVTLDYADGVSGHGEIRIKVYADAVLLSTSGVYVVDPDCAVPVRPLTWSALKKVWPSDGRRQAVLPRPR